MGSLGFGKKYPDAKTEQSKTYPPRLMRILMSWSTKKMGANGAEASRQKYGGRTGKPEDRRSN